MLVPHLLSCVCVCVCVCVDTGGCVSALVSETRNRLHSKLKQCSVFRYCLECVQSISKSLTSVGIALTLAMCLWFQQGGRLSHLRPNADESTPLLHSTQSLGDLEEEEGEEEEEVKEGRGSSFCSERELCHFILAVVLFAGMSVAKKKHN